MQNARRARSGARRALLALTSPKPSRQDGPGESADQARFFRTAAIDLATYATFLMLRPAMQMRPFLTP